MTLRKSAITELSLLPGRAAATLLTAISLVLMPRIATAAETEHPVKGQIYAIGTSELAIETEAFTSNRAGFSGTFAADDPSSIVHLTTYDCSVLTHASMDESRSRTARVGAIGVCLVSDRDGDVFVAEWRRPVGDATGTWTIVRGSGKFEGAAGEGSYGIEFLTGLPNAKMRFALDGSIITR